MHRRHIPSSSLIFLSAALVLYLLSLFPRPADPVPTAAVSCGESVESEITLEGLSVCLLRTSVVSSEASVRLDASLLLSSGAADCIQPADSGYCAVCGAFDAESPAERFASAIGLTHYNLERVSCDPVVLRIVAAQPEIDALVRADAFLRNLFRQYGVIADTASDAPSARLLCAVLDRDAEQALSALRAVRGWEEESLTSSLESLLALECGALDTLVCGPDPDIATLRGILRRNAVELCLRHIAILDNLTA